MNRKRVIRLAGWTWCGVGLALVLFTTLASTVCAQGRGQGGMQGGMQGRGQAGPGGGTQASAQVIPPPTGGTAENPSGLPHALGSDTLAQVLQRNLIATMAMNAKNEALTPLHLRYELKLTDYKNKEHTGTYETWISKDGVHTVIHTDAYDDSDLTKGDSVWANEKGLRPLRIMEFAEVHMMNRTVLAIAMRGDQKMKDRTVDGVTFSCGGDDSRGAVCIDPATGYVSLVIRDTQKVAYEGWKPVGPLHLATTVRETYGKHELFEAKLTDASVDVSADAMAIPAGAIQEPAGTRLDEQRGLVFRTEAHPQLPMNMRKPGGPQPTPYSSGGQAQLRVWVDEKGMVSKAVVEDADDKEAADAGYSRATLLQYIPYVENGKPAAFETSYAMRTMGGGGGGMRMGGRGGGGGGGGGMGEGGGGGEAPGGGGSPEGM